MVDNTPFVNNLILQGYDIDTSTWIDLWTIDANIHEGWNSKDWEEGEKPSYNRYQFAGSAEGACRIGEIQAQGVLAIDNDDDSYSCPVNVIVDGETTSLSPITVEAASTPELELIEPRFGSRSDPDSAMIEIK